MADTNKIRLLRLYLKLLPHALPQEGPLDSINKLLVFNFNPGWLESIGEEASVNIEIALWGFGMRNRDDIFKIQVTPRSSALESLADVLEHWYPSSESLNQRLQNVMDSAAAIICSEKPSLEVYYARTGKAGPGHRRLPDSTAGMVEGH
ncbi:hypothetical protein DFH07DRAFT_780486 [Mycena maculata]|uniref:Uncharacterized protein n=1 Tax=Mycena maculata TaxID=230809 RepID=A0AAD7I2V6_9AGAR|nr:hypothetical protein DFH07DRAFT_780486 [Mycena maculata]